jgi:hypothetical protein
MIVKNHHKDNTPIYFLAALGIILILYMFLA